MSTLAGASILVVEDEPLIALDVARAFEDAGARVTTTNSVKHATILVEHDDLSAAILDHALQDGDANHLCERLNHRSIPFIVYSGFGQPEDHCKNAPHVAKPANPAVLVGLVADLMQKP